MERHSILSLAVLAILCQAGLATAAPTIDQTQPDGSILIATFAQPDLAQSFQQAHANVVGAGILLDVVPVDTSGRLTIELWDNLPNDGGAMLAGAGAGGASGNWVDVFWSPVAVVPDTTLFLVFTADNPALGLAGAETNPYPRGQAYATAGFEAFPALDYAFRTYYEPAVSVIPTPSAILLTTLGAGLVAWLHRRRTL